MRPTLIAVAFAGLYPALWAQHSRSMVDQSQIERSGRSIRPRTRLSAGHKKGETAAVAAAAQHAPGVVQINLNDPTRPAWFVATAVIPKSSKLTAFITLPDDTDVPLDTLTATSDIQPGQSIFLPAIRFGDFWPLGITTYTVEVSINGAATSTATDVLVGDAWKFSDLPKLAPFVTSTATQLNARNTIATVRGIFTADPVNVVLEDIVVPPNAIQVSGNQITVNLSQVPGFDLTSVQELLLTIGQAGFCDTAVYRFIPQK